MGEKMLTVCVLTMRFGPTVQSHLSTLPREQAGGGHARGLKCLRSYYHFGV